MAENSIDDVMFENLTGKLAKVFGVDPANQRIDSVHIRPNMRRLGRIAIFSRTIAKFLVNLKRHQRTLFDALRCDIIDRYWGEKALAAFSLVKPTESEKTLKQFSHDLFDLVEQFKPLSEFTFNDEGYVEACPAGHVPALVKHKKKTDRYSAAFDPTLCQGCPHAVGPLPGRAREEDELSALPRQAISAIMSPFQV